jgi:hypothetical protein
MVHSKGLGDARVSVRVVICRKRRTDDTRSIPIIATSSPLATLAYRSFAAVLSFTRTSFHGRYRCTRCCSYVSEFTTHSLDKYFHAVCILSDGEF